jgi:hypothetical protein
VAGLARPKHTFDLLQGLVGGKADGLIQQQDAVDTPAIAFPSSCQGRSRSALGVTIDGAIDQRTDSGATLYRGVIDKPKMGHASQIEARLEMVPQVTLGMIQCLFGFGWIGIAVKAGEIYSCLRQIPANVDAGNGNVVNPRITDLPLNQVGDFTLQQMGNSSRTIGFLVHERNELVVVRVERWAEAKTVYSFLATSTRS